MKLKSLVNRTINKAEVEAYCFAYIKYRSLVLDILIVVCLFGSILFSGKGIARVALAAALMLALFRLGERIVSLRKDSRKQRQLKELSPVEEAKRIINNGRLII